MDGELGLDSEAGVGSTFWFEVEAEVAGPESPRDGLDLMSKRALVCARDAVLREALQADLESWGAATESASSLRQASEILSGEAFDVVLCEESPEPAALGEASQGLDSDLVIRLVPFGFRVPEAASPRHRCVVKPITRSRLAAALRSGLADAPAAETEPTTPVAGSRFSGCRVLLVEDDSVNAIVASRMLELLGVEVELAGNGLEGVASAEERRYDLILLDCEMPEMDGYTAVAEIRRTRLNRETPVVALTAHASDRDRQRCLQAGMDDYIAKPVTLVAVKETLKRWLRAVGTDGQ